MTHWKEQKGLESGSLSEVLALPLTSCVILGKSLSLCIPICEMWIILALPTYFLVMTYGVIVLAVVVVTATIIV